VILIDDRQREVLDVAAEGVAEHDELQQRKTIDMTISIGLLLNRRISRSMMAMVRCIVSWQLSLHYVPAYRRIMNGLSAAAGACSASRRSRPA
jgi:hypothetical protein